MATRGASKQKQLHSIQLAREKENPLKVHLGNRFCAFKDYPEIERVLGHPQSFATALEGVF